MSQTLAGTAGALSAEATIEREDPEKVHVTYALVNDLVLNMLNPPKAGWYVLLFSCICVALIGGLCFAYQMLKNYPDAVAEYQNAVARNPKDYQAYYNMGLSYYHMKKPDKAISAYKNAVKYNPKHAEAFTNLGLAYHEKKEYILAKNAFAKALSLKPDLGEALFGMARIFKQQEEYESALEYAQKAVRAGKHVSENFIKELKENLEKKSPSPHE